MTQRIIYKEADGTVGIIIPADEVLDAGYTVQQIAAKDVPAGLSYKIVDISDVPSDRSLRDYWDVNDLDLTDGVGSESNEFEVDP
jgi:hypothetical protein